MVPHASRGVDAICGAELRYVVSTGRRELRTERGLRGCAAAHP